MRIALICPQLPPYYNGCGDATDRLAREFQRRGCSTLVLTDDVKTTVHPYPTESVGAWDLHSVVQTKRQLDAFDPSIVLMQYTPFLYHPRSMYPYLAMKALRRYRRVTYVHECFYPASSIAVRSRAKAAYLQMRDNAVIAASDTIYVASPQREAALVEKAPSARSKVRVVPFGANVEPAGTLPPRRTPQPPYRLTAFGIVLRRRRLELLVAALAELRARGMQAELNIIGRIQEPAYRAECEALAAQLGVADAVRFAGPLAPLELARAFAQCDLFLHAAEEGAIPSAGSLLAALAHGVPVLCASTPYDDDRFAGAALFAQPGASAMADAIERVLGAPDELQARATLSRALYDQEFGWSRMADRIAADARLPKAS